MKANDFHYLRVIGLASAIALGAVGAGCGDDGETNETDSGTQNDSGIETDSGTVTDAGSDEDASTETDAGPTDAGVQVKDIVVIRLTPAGAVDEAYGTDGQAVVDIGSANDVVTGLSIHREAANLDKVVVFGNRTSPAMNATDTARFITRLTANGSGIDTAGFAAGATPPGIHVFNLAGLNDGAKHGHVLPDGSIIASGYTSQPSHVGSMSANRIILVRLAANGTPVNTFGSKGILNANPFDLGPTIEHGFAEAYGVSVIDHGGDVYGFATTGYGRVNADSAIQVAQISTLFTSTGALDATWTGTTLGMQPGTAVVHPSRSVDHDMDPSPASPPLSFEARGRNIATLPGNAVLAVGSANYSSSSSSNAHQKDILVAAISPTGSTTSITIGGGATDVVTEDANGGARLRIGGQVGYSDEACFGVDVSPDGNFVAIACYRAQMGVDTDAVLGIFSIQKDVGGVATGLTLVSLEALDLSATENDRIDVVAFSRDSSRLYAAGYTTVGMVQQMAIVCKDTTGAACTGFGTNGVVLLPASTAVNGITVDSMGRILVAGSITRTL